MIHGHGFIASVIMSRGVILSLLFFCASESLATG